jgi:tetraacyldisaccharide 4'-kinase
MKAPDFWWHMPLKPLSRLLSPFAWIYGAITAHRFKTLSTKISCSVICIGNFTVGGTGKTPVVASLAALLTDQGHRPFILSRGYGGRLKGPVVIDTSYHTAKDVGDEPLLLAAHAPVIVARDRVAGAQLAIKNGASIIIMDDGLQNPALHKDLVLSVIDGAMGFGNMMCFPSGPLRAPLNIQWLHCDALVIVGEGAATAQLINCAKNHQKPVLRAYIKPDPKQTAQLCGQHVLAFAGIGRPEKFFQTLRENGAEVVICYGFADHRIYKDHELIALRDEALAKDLRLVTTRKDMMRLSASQKLLFKDDLTVLDVTLEWQDHGALKNLLSHVLSATQLPA